MESNERHLEHLAEIRAMMERSTRFISLSGLSGVWAGVCALAGAAAVYAYLELGPFTSRITYYERAMAVDKWGMGYKMFFITVGICTLLAALAGGLFFTGRKARSKGLRMWDAGARRLLWSLAVPLFSGGVFCLAMLYWGLPGLVAPATLVFYGLALVNGSKYTLGDVGVLGMLEIALGLTGLFFLGKGLELWALGFGALHILYGIRMYYKYDRS